MIKKLVSLIGINILNYVFIENVSLFNLKNYILFVMLIVSINFLYGLNEREKYELVCLQNVMLYNRLMSYDGFNIDHHLQKNKMLDELKSYQKNIGKCIVPYCTLDKKCGLLCENHCRFKDDKCPICLEELKEDELPQKCGHFFHSECIFKIRRNICPICRSEI
jgi:hypothetical protein